MKFFAKNCFLFILTNFFLFHNLCGQEVWVEDSVTGEPLENAVIFSENGSHNLLTNAIGKVVLDDFPRRGLVNISLMGYQPKSISMIEILQGKKAIQLTSEDEVLEEVVLSVARSQVTRDKIAEQVGIISKKEIEIAAVATGADLLEINPILGFKNLKVEVEALF